MTEEENKTVDQATDTEAKKPTEAATEKTEAKVEEKAPEATAPKTEETKKEEPKTDAKPAAATQRRDNRQGGQRGRGGPQRGRRKNFRREKPEFDQKIVSLRRVTRVMAGGRRFSFSAAIVIGDKKGRVGFGLAKANDTAAAIDKAIRIAKKDMITLKLTENNSIPHDVQVKYKASEVLLRPVTGKGLAAGGGVRVVLELAGVDEVGGKLLSRSKNNINNARVTIEALRTFAVKK